MYLKDSGFKDFQGYISICYSVFTILGTVFTGNFFERTTNRVWHFVVAIIELAVSFVCLLLIYRLSLTIEEKYTLLVLVGLTGFCLGALFEIYANHEIMVQHEA